MNQTFYKVCLFLIIVGALNWGLVGLFNLNLVASLFGTSFIANLIYIVIGVSGIVSLGILFNDKW